MSIRLFILSAIALFILGAVPFLLAQPSAAASAGLSLGFSAPLEHFAMFAVLLTVGIISALLPRDGLVLMPFAFALMIMLGGLTMLDVAHYPSLRLFILGTVLCMGLMIGVAREKLTVLMLMVLASVGFHLGGFYMSSVPAIVAPIYYLLGVLFSLGFGLAIAIAFGVTLVGDNEALWERIKESPRFSFIRGLFV